MEDATKTRGIFDLTNRLLQVMLSKPLFKKVLNTMIASLDPERAPDIVRTLIWHDLGVGLQLVDAVPKLANAGIMGAEELISQLEDHFTPGFIQEIAAQILEDVDFAALKRVSDGLARLGALIGPVIEQLAAEADNAAGQAMSNPGGGA